VSSGSDGDVPAALGAYALRAGDRYLVLGLTITDKGPNDHSIAWIAFEEPLGEDLDIGPGLTSADPGRQRVAAGPGVGAIGAGRRSPGAAASRCSRDSRNAYLSEPPLIHFPFLSAHS
jgi:hypothetical protein